MNSMTLPKDLPPMETEFDIQVTGLVTKTIYEGTFRYKIPNIGKNSQIAVMEARLNSGQYLDPSNKMMNYMVSYLRYTLDEKSLPAWWADSGYGAELFDANVVTEIYQKCFKFESEWNQKVHGEQS